MNTRILLVKGKAGLGNRILSLLGSILYADITSREIIVDWSDPAYSDDRTNVFNRFFSSPITSGVEAVPAQSTIWPPAWEGQLPSSVDELLSACEPGNSEADEIPSIAGKYTADFRKLDYR